MGAGEIWITPSNGKSSSRIKKIAPATDNAASITATMTVAFGGAFPGKMLKAPHIRINLFIFIGFVCCGFGLSFVFLGVFVWLLWLSQLKPCPGEKEREHSMQHDCRPQQL